MPLIFHNQLEFEQEVILRSRNGFSIRSLSRMFQISRNTVRRILRDHAHDREVSHEILPRIETRSSKLDAFKPQMKELLEKHPKITGQRLFEELKTEALGILDMPKMFTDREDAFAVWANKLDAQVLGAMTKQQRDELQQVYRNLKAEIDGE